MHANIDFSNPIRILARLLICALFLPAPMVASASPEQGYVNEIPGNGHILRRLGSLKRARTNAYMRTGLQNGHGMLRYCADLSDELHHGLWGRDDSTQGGRVSRSSGYSRSLSGFDPMTMALDRGLSYGVGLVNSMGEAALSGLVDGGRARLNFRLDRDGYFSGEGDTLLPLYDGNHSTLYTQLGARSMRDSSDTRWVGNVGLGQRWFPLASGENFDAIEYDAGTLMLGYNVFFDYDFTRDHQRGGFGAEVWYDWLRLSSNYYFPLSNWKGSEDFDSRFVKERPAEGWDARIKAYLPLYRHIALTGAYSQWYGDHVGMFGSDSLEKDPRVWSYGLEYTPVPLVSGFIRQENTERGRTATEFGLNVTYHFHMPWEDQITPAKVVELRTVGGSRHEFVDRESRIILEYKAKNAYRIEYLGKTGANTFTFRLTDGFGKPASGKSASVSLAGATFAGDLAISFFTSDGNGEFTLQLDRVGYTPAPATIQAGSTSQTFMLEAEVPGGILRASADTVTNGGTVTLTVDGGAGNAAHRVNWQIVSGPGSLASAATTTDSFGVSTNTLTGNSTGSGHIVVQATVSGKSYEVTVTLEGSYRLIFAPVSGGGNFISGASTTADVTVELQQNGLAYTTSAVTVTWSVISADNSANLAVTGDFKKRATGLNWGGTAIDPVSAGNDLSTTTTSNTSTGNGRASVQLTDILGERRVRVQAKVSINGVDYTALQDVPFGKGPISVFKAPDGTSEKWSGDRPITGSTTSFPAAEYCMGSVTTGSPAFYNHSSWESRGQAYYYAKDSKLPKGVQLLAVSNAGNGAWAAAGWPTRNYWTGEVIATGGYVYLENRNGADAVRLVNDYGAVVCLR